jgi:hypothetical protein
MPTHVAPSRRLGLATAVWRGNLGPQYKPVGVGIVLQDVGRKGCSGAQSVVIVESRSIGPSPASPTIVLVTQPTYLNRQGNIVVGCVDPWVAGFGNLN